MSWSVGYPDTAEAGATHISGWLSDFGKQFDQHLGVIRYTVAPDGTTDPAVASYPMG